MTLPAVHTVREFLRAADDRNFSRAIQLIADEAVIHNSRGRIYIGRAGVEDWRRDTDAAAASRHFEATNMRELGAGYVLVTGTEHHDPHHGAAEATPGAWIYLVRDGLVGACMYFRTERDALASLGGAARGERVAEIVERCVSAFNRDDFDALVAELDDELRFRPVLVDGEIIAGIDRFIDALVTLRVNYDDVLIEDLDVDEIAPDRAIALTTIRAVDHHAVIRRRLAHTVRVKGGRVAEWLPFERVEAARTAIATGASFAAVEHKPR
jgi:limonene-1,2-epoxide hydrolase